MVEADAVSLREALANLIHNALTHGARTHLSVRLIKPFETGGPRSGGSGLGLAIASKVVNTHGGMLSFEFAPPYFWFKLSFPTLIG